MMIIKYIQAIKRITITTILYIASILMAVATTDSLDYPQVGKPCPDFILKNMEYYPKTEVSLADFRGKWLILDFWNEYCAACIRSFPKIDEIQQEFANDIQFLLIGTTREREQQGVESIRKLYEKHREEYSLKIPIVYDNNLSKRFQVNTVPHLVVIDPEGIVRYVTLMLNKEDVRKIINNEKPKLPFKHNMVESTSYDDYDLNTPLLLYNNGGNEEDYYLRSVFTEANPLLMPSGKSWLTNDKVEIINFPLDKFYFYAFTGQLSWELPNDSLYSKVWRKLIFETKDTTLFAKRADKSNNFAYSAGIGEKYKNRFLANNVNFAEMLRSDLEHIMPFDAVMEKRMMSCNILYIHPDKLNNLKSESDTSNFQWTGAKRQGFIATRVPIRFLINRLVLDSPDYDRSTPLIYEGVDEYIDININSVSFGGRKKELEKLGFEIRQEEREMSVIVIRDKN